MKKDIRIIVKEEFPEFVEEIAAAQSPDLNNRLSELAKNMEAVDEAKDADQALKDAKQQSFDFGAPYRDAKKAIKLKSRYIIAMLKDRGEA